jgi:hypothetical protein
MIHALVVRKIIHRSRRVRLRVLLLLFGLVMRSFAASAQVGSGTPQASVRVQVETKAKEAERSDVAPLVAGQALDQDARALPSLVTDPLTSSSGCHGVR